MLCSPAWLPALNIFGSSVFSARASLPSFPAISPYHLDQLTPTISALDQTLNLGLWLDSAFALLDQYVYLPLISLTFVFVSEPGHWIVDWTVMIQISGFCTITVDPVDVLGSLCCVCVLLDLPSLSSQRFPFKESSASSITPTENCLHSTHHLCSVLTTALTFLLLPPLSSPVGRQVTHLLLPSSTCSCPFQNLSTSGLHYPAFPATDISPLAYLSSYSLNTQ